jgi:hypothetical protein
VDYLPDFLAATLGGALALEMTLLLGFVLLLFLRAVGYTAARRRWRRK